MQKTAIIKYMFFIKYWTGDPQPKVEKYVGLNIYRFTEIFQHYCSHAGVKRNAWFQGWSSRQHSEPPHTQPGAQRRGASQPGRNAARAG